MATELAKRWSRFGSLLIGTLLLGLVLGGARVRARGLPAPSADELRIEDPDRLLDPAYQSQIEALVAEFLEQTGEADLKLPRFVLTRRGPQRIVGLAGPAHIRPRDLQRTVRAQL